jgi:hypothetical protein
MRQGSHCARAWCIGTGDVESVAPATATGLGAKRYLLRVVGVSRLVRACLVQVTVVLSRIVRVPFTHKVLVFHALVAARVESACGALALGAYFHILVVGLRAPNRTPFVPKPAGPNRDGGPYSAAPSVGAATPDLVLVARCSTTARLHHSIAPFEHGAGLAIASRSGFSSAPNTPVTNA